MGMNITIKETNEQQQEMNQRLADVENQEENVLRNIQEAWMYNANEPYYPTGRLGSQPAQSGFLAGGSSNTQSSFLNAPQSTFGSTSSFLKPATSFGSSPFGAMPASAFSLGSRDPNASNQSAFGATPSTSTSTSAFGQARSTGFGAASSTPSSFGSASLGGTAPTFGAASNPTNPQHTFGQPSTLGAGGLPPPPGSGFGAKPTFGQTSTLGALGSSTSTFGQTSTPTFGQASAFSSPFAGGLGKALGGTTSTGAFGSKSTFGTFGQAANQPSAFAQAAGTSQQNAFLQAAGQGQHNAFTQSANQFSAPAANVSTPATDAFGAESTRSVRFTELNEMDDDMTDAISPGVATDATQSPITVSQEGANQPQAPTSVSAPSSQPAAQTTHLSNAFGGLTTSSQSQSQEQPSSTAPLTQTPPILKPSSSTTTTTTPAKTAAYKKPIIDEMTAWRAGEFTIGQIPETEPPFEVR